MTGRPRAYRLSPRATDDLEEIWRFTMKTWSIDQADHYLRQIMATIEALANGTSAGRETTIRRGYRQREAGSHIVFYRSSKDRIDVIRVLHRRMDIAAHL